MFLKSNPNVLEIHCVVVFVCVLILMSFTAKNSTIYLFFSFFSFVFIRFKRYVCCWLYDDEQRRWKRRSDVGNVVCCCCSCNDNNNNNPIQFTHRKWQQMWTYDRTNEQINFATVWLTDWMGVYNRWCPSVCLPLCVCVCVQWC